MSVARSRILLPIVTAFVPWIPIGPPCAQPVSTSENAETPSAGDPARARVVKKSPGLPRDERLVVSEGVDFAALPALPPLDDAEASENAIRRALEADPANPEVLDALAGLFKRRGRIRVASGWCVGFTAGALAGTGGSSEKKSDWFVVVMKSL